MAGGQQLPDEVDSEVLLAQGDELLKSSRRLLEELDDITSTDEPTSK